MNFSDLIIIALIILVAISFFLALPVATFLLYYYRLRKKGKRSKNIGLAIFIFSVVGMIILAIKIFVGPSGFGPDYDNAEIKQIIGGKLLCKSIHTADFQSFETDVNYKYLTKYGDTIKLGDGTYFNSEWEKDEQLQKLGNWLILITGSMDGYDRIILKNIKTNSMRIFDINDNFIENDSLWKSKKIKVLSEYCCPETNIKKIEKGKIILKYRFRISKNLFNKYDKRMITLQIDSITGNIKIVKIIE